MNQLLILSAFGCLWPFVVPGQSITVDVAAIRAGSVIMNRAYATKDTALLGTLLAPDF
jgi:hypothetical protein